MFTLQQFSQIISNFVFTNKNSKIFFYYFSFTFFLLTIPSITNAQNSVLAQGEFYKLAITNPQGAVYKIDKNFLLKLGINPQNINPQNIQIFGNGGGMLPQANQTPRADDLIENAIFVQGEGDGKFDDTDFILFYAEGSDKLVYDSNLQFIRHEKNLYSTQNYYFITIGTKAGKRITATPTITNPANSIESFDEVDYWEDEQENIADSGRLWFGKTLFGGDTQNFSLKNCINLADDASLNIIAQTFAASRFKTTELEISLNNKKITTFAIPASPSFDTNTERYVPKGNIEPKPENPVLISLVAKNFIATDGNTNFSLKFDNKADGNASANFDFLVMNVQRKLQLYGNFTRFRSIRSISNPINEYKIGGITEPNTTQVWDITDSKQIFSHTLTNPTPTTASFKAKNEGLREYIVLKTNANFENPVSIGKIPNQNLHALPVPDFVIITHPTLLEAANKLADFRKKNDNLEVLVITTEQVYNEFSSGRKDVSAIRDFTKYMYKKSKKLKYLLLFGNGSYNHKGETDYVPTYESHESIHPIYSFASDDYYGMLDEKEGEWAENSGNLDNLEIGIGRIPFRILGNTRIKEQANAIVDKIIAYSNGKSMGTWRNEVCFVADNGDNNNTLFQGDSETLATRLDAQIPNLVIDKLYLDAFPTTLTANGITSPIVRQKLNEEVETGALFINFIGHGSESGWTAEKILDEVNAASWQGLNNMPLMMTATCEFGRYDGQVKSGAEVALLNPKGGAIALLTTTRPVYSNNNEVVNRAFVDNIFKPLADGTMPRLGDLVRIVKNNSILGVANRNFVLLGDPSLRLAYPKIETVLTKIEVDGKESTQFTALSKVTISGEIQDKGILQSNFNGTAYISVLDKAYRTNTLGLIDGKMSYVLQDNLLYKGQATVTNGKFTATFVVPKNIDYKDGNGKILLYATNDELTIDAKGANRAIKISGSRNNPPLDNTAPTVQMYMDTPSFVSGNKVEKNTTLFVNLTDISGFNVSATGIGQDMVVILNDTIKYVVSKYFQTEKDDFTKGKIVFPLKNLQSGKYTLVFRVWDTYNNASETSLQFYVDYEPFTIKSTVYPNPFSNNVRIEFSHNRSNEIPILINYEIFNSLGQSVVKSYTAEYQVSPTIFQIEWNGTGEGGGKLTSGMYFYRITIEQFIKNGEKATFVGKLLFLP
jgi:hypothetical protein